MTEFLDEAKQEIKRADHLIYVSLKYTRTVDVIRNVIERLINCIDFCMQHLLETKKEEGIIEAVPGSVIEKVEMTKKLYPSELVTSSLEFYMFLRLLLKAEFTRQREFRRHVTMSAFVPEKGVVEVNINIIHEYYTSTKNFLKFAEGGEEE